MKVLIVVHYFLPHIGGIENVVVKQADSLASMGHDVTILTCRNDRKLALHEKANYKLERVRALNFIENKFGVTFPIISPLLFFKLLKQLDSYDTVHMHDVFYLSSHMAGLAAVIRKKPFFITQHVAMVDHPSKFIMSIQNLIYKTIGKFLFNRAESIVVYNANVKDFLLTLGVDSAKILQNYNGIDTEHFSPTATSTKLALRAKYNIPANKPVVLFVGRLVPKKGFDLVFNARSNSHTTLIVGNGQIPNHMKNKDNVIFFGPATQAQLTDLYRLSDIFASPAIGELFTLVVLEAMACGLPAIMTDAPEFSQYDLKRELLGFTKRETHAIKHEIDELLNNNQLRQRMGRYSRQLALKNFSWQRNYKSELRIYDQLLEQTAAPSKTFGTGDAKL